MLLAGKTAASVRALPSPDRLICSSARDDNAFVRSISGRLTSYRANTPVPQRLSIVWSLLDGSQLDNINELISGDFWLKTDADADIKHFRLRRSDCRFIATDKYELKLELEEV